MKLSREEYARLRLARPDVYPAIEAGDSTPSPQPEPPVRHEPVAAPPGEACYTMRVRIRVTSFRVRLLDPDNLCPKYFIDCLRYANCIRDDRQQDISLEIRQEKVASKLLERTEIEIEPI